ncbi:unnamed protein product [Boreogadus saida]
MADKALNDEEERAMATIGYSASQGIPGGEWISLRVSQKREILHITASISGRGCQCSQDLVELEREKVALLRESSERDARFQKEVIVLKRAKLDLMARQLVLEEERISLFRDTRKDIHSPGDALGG